MILYNTFSRKKEIFRPIHSKTISIYTCGPTVYDYDHIGHAWNYTMADILRRVLEYNGYKTKHVLNITDVGHLEGDNDTGEDKIEKRAKEKQQSARLLAQYYTKIYFQHRQQLNLLKPHIICKASQHIPEMIKLIAKLMEKKYAYITPDGIYFRIKKFPRYGQLSGNTIQNLKAGARVQINIHKEHPADFALWKFTPPESKRQMEWKSPWGKGFPGWHIECSAMSMKYLGATIDIHTGGEDNIFPHHEAEIAQSEAVTNKKFVRFWFHPRFLMVNGEKMSKSLRNFYTLEDLQNKGFSPLALRYLFLTAHYRSKLNFNWQALAASQKALNNLYNEIAKLNINITAKTIHKNKKNYKTNKILSYEKKFVRAINNDLNIPQALSLVWQILKNTQLSANEKKFLVLRFDKVLGLNLHNIKTPKIPQKIKQLAIKREILRSNKQFIQADNLRKKIEQLGYKIEDTNQGPRIIKTKI